MNDTTGRKRLLSAGLRVLAVVSFVAVLSIGMWGSVQVAKAVPNAMSSLATAIASLSSVFIPAGSQEEIILSAPALTIASGEEISISWEHVGKGLEGSYAFRYNCADGVHFTSPASTGSEGVVFCNAPFRFLDGGNSVSLTALSAKNRFIDVTLFIDFTPNGGTQATVTGSTVLTIVNEDISTSPSVITPGTDESLQPPAPSTPVITTSVPSQGQGTGSPLPATEEVITVPVSSNPNGQADLAGRIIEVGTVNKTTNVFTASSTPYSKSQEYRVAIRFSIENAGNKTSPQFTFNAVLPSFPQHIFSSAGQPELKPGDRIEYTLAFDQFVDADEGLFTLNIDPSNRVNERNKDNNLVKYTIKVTR